MLLSKSHSQTLTPLGNETIMHDEKYRSSTNEALNNHEELSKQKSRPTFRKSCTGLSLLTPRFSYMKASQY